MGRIFLRCSRSAHNAYREFRGALYRAGPMVCDDADIPYRRSATPSAGQFLLKCHHATADWQSTTAAAPERPLSVTVIEIHSL
jgi:hypothetical protein